MVSEVILKYPVQTLDNQILLPAGSVLTKDVLDPLISSNTSYGHQQYSLMLYGTVKDDMIYYLSHPPYDVIFSDAEQVMRIMDLMENVILTIPILQTLDYFKKNEPPTYRHILIVFALSTMLSMYLISDYHERIKEASSCPTHDIGKICVPLNIIKKTTPLTKKEHSLLEHHTAAGFVLMSYYLKDANKLSARVARDHHERKNGSGYPRGVELEDFLVEIVAVSDIYDALISPRPYRPISYDNRTACEELTTMAERGEVSWEIVRALIAHNRKSRPHYSECDISNEKRGEPPPGNLYGIIIEYDKSTSDT